MSREKLKFNSFGKTIDGTSYCSEVETIGENILEDSEEDATLIYPGEGKWASLRSSQYRITTDSLVMTVPFPIYRLKSVKIIPTDVNVIVGNISLPYEEFLKDGKPIVPDISPFVIEEHEWKKLQVARNDGIAMSGVYKNNTFYYTQGDNKINVLATTYKNGVLFNEPVYKTLIQSFFRQYGKGYTKKVDTVMDLSNLTRTESLFPDKWLYQIEYVPLSSATKMKAHKETPTTLKYTQIVNQRAEVNSATAFGKMLYTEAQKMGTERITIVKTHKKLAEIPPIGAVIWHEGKKYRLVAKNYEMTNCVYIKVTYTLSANWSDKSKHISVDQKYRNYAIPFNSYVWRTIYYEEFIEVGKRLDKNEIYKPSNFSIDAQNAIGDTFNCAAANKSLNNLFLYKEGDGFEEPHETTTGGYRGDGVVASVITQGLGRSMLFSATMQDNLSAGMRISTDNSQYCDEVYYCKEDGRLEKCTVILSTGIRDTGYSANFLPAALNDTNQPSSEAFRCTFNLDKDPAEAIKVTIQAHFIPNQEWCILGAKIAQNNPLIVSKQKKFRFWLLQHYLQNGEEYVQTKEGDTYTQIEDDETRVQFFNATHHQGEPQVNLIINADTSSAVAWAITDENNLLYIGSNNAAEKSVWFTFTRRHPLGLSLNHPAVNQ